MKPVLVLDSSYRPIKQISWQKAMTMYFQEKIEVVKARLGPAKKPLILTPKKISLNVLLSKSHICGSKPKKPINSFNNELSALPKIIKKTEGYCYYKLQ